MNAVTRYFKNIRDAVSTTLTGMRITLRYWTCEPAITVEYPDRLGEGKTSADLVSDRYRGHLNLDAAQCIGCMQCMRACPINCIRIVVEKGAEGRMLARFDINQARCMYCGLCVDECPSRALTFSKRFEGACFSIQNLRREHILVPIPVARLRNSAKGGTQ